MSKSQMSKSQMSINKCPCLVDEEDSFYPTNTCKPQWNYCMHLGEYADCDVFKRHNRVVEFLSKEIQRKHEEN